MKRILTYMMACALSVFFLLAGTGLNVVHYCCSACRAAGIESVSRSSCEEVHHKQGTCHHHHTAAHADCCQDCQHSADNCCWIRHYSVDEGGISASLSLPAQAMHQLLTSIMTQSVENILSSLIQINGSPDHPQYDSGPRVTGGGQCVLVRVCRWLL